LRIRRKGEETGGKSPGFEEDFWKQGGFRVNKQGGILHED
jgi:hypothetical protein